MTWTLTPVWTTVTFLSSVLQHPTASSADASCCPSTSSSAFSGWGGTCSSSSPSSTSSAWRPWRTCICSTCPLQTCSSLCRCPFGHTTPPQNGGWVWPCAKQCTQFTRSAYTAACLFSLSSAWNATLSSPRPSPLTATAPEHCFSARCHQSASGWWHWSSPYQKWPTPQSLTTPARLTAATLTCSTSK